MSSSLLILSYRGNGSLTLQSKSKCDMTDVLWMSTLNKQIFRVLSSILPLSLSLTTKVSPCSCGWKRFDVTYSTKIEAGMNCLLQVSWELQNENYHGHRRTRMSGLQSRKEVFNCVINGCHQFICRPFTEPTFFLQSIRPTLDVWTNQNDRNNHEQTKMTMTKTTIPKLSTIMETL